MNYATLLFPDYATAVQAAKALGFWNAADDRLSTEGQTIRVDGTAFSWAIDEIGTDPVVRYDSEGNELANPLPMAGFAVNVCGELPPQVMAYAIPYGSAGQVFGGIPAEPFVLVPDGPEFVRAVSA